MATLVLHAGDKIDDMLIWDDFLCCYDVNVEDIDIIIEQCKSVEVLKSPLLTPKNVKLMS